MREQVQTFATSLLDHARTSYELEVMLNYNPTGDNWEPGERQTLERLKLGIKYKQKQVGHFRKLQFLPTFMLYFIKWLFLAKLFKKPRCQKIFSKSELFSIWKKKIIPNLNKFLLIEFRITLKKNFFQFVAHPNVQQLLAAIWYDGLPGFRRLSMINQLIEVGKLGAMFPVYSTIYMLQPTSKMGLFMKKPFVKFICHSASYAFFLSKNIHTLLVLR